ncbi:MAG: polynucleotide adenylyltransferase PcnB [Kiritimatiellia bacterium]
MQPVIIPREQHTVSRKDISPEALKVLYRLREAGYTAYLAGGCVRDLLLGRTPKDFDVATNARPEEVRRAFGHCRIIGRRFRLAHVVFGPKVIEVATFRSNPSGETRHAQVEDGLVVRDNEYGSPEEDALRRDFTVNALFYDIDTFSLIDFAGAMEDIRRRRLHCIGNPDQRYVEDPVRMLRAVRFAGSIGLEFEKETYDAILRNRHQLANAAPARLHEEMLKFLHSGSAETCLPMLLETGLLDFLFADWAAWWRESATDRDKEWIAAALRTMDRFKKNGHAASPALIYGLLFGSYHRALAARLQQEEGLLPVAAIMEAVTRHHRSITRNVTLPQKMMLHLRHLVSTPSRFERLDEHRAALLAQRYYFRDAVIFYKFSAPFTGAPAENVAWWTDFLRRAPEVPPDDERLHPGRQRRRRRRRGPRPDMRPHEPG